MILIASHFSIPITILHTSASTAQILKAIYDSLKPDGEFVVGDYPAKPGAGASVVRPCTARMRRW